jgi:molybdopterin-guanine dinucleotide biosynthesis protein A
MRLLGAILAGGKSSRFGRNKAQALLMGKTLIDHTSEALKPQCETLVICGKTGTNGDSLEDRPAADLGPLGGLNAALHFGLEKGFDAVLTAACDNAALPGDLAAQLAEGPSYVAGQPVIGLWPTALANRLDAWLSEAKNRSVYGWISHCNAREVRLAHAIPNINEPADLAALEKRHRL